MISRRILAAALCAILSASAAGAQTAAVQGRALADDGAPVPLSVIRLLPATGGSGRTVLTDARGAFRFDTVAAGSYRLRMERIGYTAPPSAEFVVGAGGTSEHTLRAALQPVVLEGVTSGRPACYTRDRLGESPAVQTLWREAIKGVEQRRAFAAQYAYRYNMRTRGAAHLRLLPDRRINSDTTILVHPDSGRARRARAEAAGDTVQGKSLMIRVPSELTLLRDDFLVGHCLEANPQLDSAGAWTLRFRPVGAAARGGLALAGALRLDSRTFAVRRIEFQYLDGRREWASGTLDFAEVSTPFGTVRLPRSSRVRADPSGRMGLIITELEGDIDFHGYRGFERVRGG
ncbi:MAG TPA: carboxypeptidase-like regulatory domain-containing protein [Longimicrobium sp.]|jgi:hypothetical protein